MGRTHASVPSSEVDNIDTHETNQPSKLNHVAAANTTAIATKASPKPSRLSVGSRSRAPEPIPLAAAPTRWASAVQILPIALPALAIARGIGPGRAGDGGFGRLPRLRAGVDDFFIVADFRLAGLEVVERVRVEEREAITPDYRESPRLTVVTRATRVTIFPPVCDDDIQITRFTLQ